MDTVSRVAGAFVAYAVIDLVCSYRLLVLGATAAGTPGSEHPQGDPQQVAATTGGGAGEDELMSGFVMVRRLLDVQAVILSSVDGAIISSSQYCCFLSRC